jgi:hypothetical protein
MSNPVGRPPLITKYRTAAEMQKKIDEYFEMIDDSKQVITDEKGRTRIIKKPAFWTRLLLHLDLTREGVRPYVNGEYDTDTNNFSDILTRARMLCEADLAENAMAGNYMEKTTGLVLQNYHNYAEKQEIRAELSQNADLSDAEIEEKLKRLLAKHQNSGA